MATAAYTGTVTISPSTVVHDIMSMDLPLKLDTTETTSFSSTTPGTKTFIPTLQGGQPKISGNRNRTDAGQNALRDAWLNRTLLTMIFAPDGTELVTMSCWVTDFATKADPKGAVSLDVSLLMDGGPTFS